MRKKKLLKLCDFNDYNSLIKKIIKKIKKNNFLKNLLLIIIFN